MLRMLIRFTTFEADGLVHAITTRAGGVSPAPWNSLNLSWARPDAAANVAENRRRLCRQLEIPPERLVQAGQIHGVGVAVVGDAEVGRGALERETVLPPSDGLITDAADVYLFACFADCVPLLFYDAARPAVGVAHAGWRGTVAGMAGEMVRAMRDAFGTHPEMLRVVIGPSAGPCCYQVGSEVIAAARDRLPDADDLLSKVDGDHAHFDLWEANRNALLRAGVSADQIETSAICTVDHATDFFSHRATGGQTGRFAALIGLRST
jgi:polyphenol oxidase